MFEAGNKLYKIPWGWGGVKPVAHGLRDQLGDTIDQFPDRKKSSQTEETIYWLIS